MAGGSVGTPTWKRSQRTRRRNLDHAQRAAVGSLHAAGPKSPLYRHTHNAWADLHDKNGTPWEPLMVSKWKLRGPIRAAQFRDKYDPTKYAVLHPSTKEKGRWQLSWFDSLGAWGDVIRSTAEEAMKDGLEGGWKLETVVGGDGKVYGKQS